MPRRGDHAIADLVRGEAFTEEDYVRHVLRETGGNVTRAAHAIGMHRSVFWYHLRRLRMGDVPREIRAAVRAEAER